MNRPALPAWALAIAVGTSWLTATPAGAATLMGSGITISCGGWVEARKGTPIKQLVEDWGLGYLSGVAMWTPESPLDNLDPAAVFVWLDNYCQQRPLEPYKSALDAFIRARSAPPPGQAPPQQQRPPAPAPQGAAPPPRPR
jgi:hypothetical protein